MKDINTEKYMEVQKHPAGIIPGFVMILITAGIFYFIMNVLLGKVFDHPGTIITVAALIYAIGGPLLVYAKWKKTKYYVSPREIVIVTGIGIPKTTLYKISPDINISVRQTHVGRIFKYGTIGLESRNAGTKYRLPNVSNPYDVYDALVSDVFEGGPEIGKYVPPSQESDEK